MCAILAVNNSIGTVIVTGTGRWTLRYMFSVVKNVLTKNKSGIQKKYNFATALKN